MYYVVACILVLYLNIFELRIIFIEAVSDVTLDMVGANMAGCRPK
jgi:hypothetical protein